jgi:hypothetical protein
VSAWLLVGWLASAPGHPETLGTYSTRDSCEARVLWLSEVRKRSKQRHYACLEVPAACPARASDQP